jgi:hypothetical protein
MFRSRPRPICRSSRSKNNSLVSRTSRSWFALNAPKVCVTSSVLTGGTIAQNAPSPHAPHAASGPGLPTPEVMSICQKTLRSTASSASKRAKSATRIVPLTDNRHMKSCLADQAANRKGARCPAPPAEEPVKDWMSQVELSSLDGELD